MRSWYDDPTAESAVESEAAAGSELLSLLPTEPPVDVVLTSFIEGIRLYFECPRWHRGEGH